jgi:hypothetical protein
MNMDEINEAFDREYDKYKNSPDYKAFVKIKMPTYYIAKHSDEDLQAAVAAEREACAEHYLAIMRDAVAQAVKRAREACAKLCEQEHDNYLQDEEPDRADGAMWCAAAIRGRTE